MTTSAAASSSTRTALRGKVLTPTQAGPLRYLADGLVVVDERGKIASVSPWSEGRPRLPVLDVRPAVITPGFIDAHVHFPQTRIIGSASGPLLRWLESSVFPEEAKFRDVAYASAVAREFVHRLRSAGTTTAVAFSSSSPLATQTLFEALDESGLRAVAGLTLMDQACPEALRLARAEAIEACEALVARWHGHDDGRLAFAVTPRFALSCSPEMLRAAGDLARRHRLRVQTHVSENAREGEETLAAHPYASSYLDVYDQAGLLGEQTILAHSIHLSPREWDRLAEAKGSVAHCPDSNFFLGSGRMRLSDARDRGIRVALGSDVAAGRSFDMRRAIASAYDNALCASVETSPAELFAAATLGGARALGLETVTGSLETGRSADLVTIDLPDYVEGEDAVLAQVAFGSDVAPVSRVYVRGRLVHRAD
jgi:guanine deaminase